MMKGTILRVAIALAVTLTLGTRLGHPDHKPGHGKPGGDNPETVPLQATYRSQFDPTFDYIRGDSGLGTVYLDVMLQQDGGWVEFPGSGNFTMRTIGAGKSSKNVENPRKLVFDFSKPLPPDGVVCTGGLGPPDIIRCEYEMPAHTSVNADTGSGTHIPGGLRDMSYPDKTIDARIGATFGNPDDSSNEFRLVCGELASATAEPDRTDTDYANVTCVAPVSETDNTESSPFLVETLHGSRLRDLLLRYG